MQGKASFTRGAGCRIWDAQDGLGNWLNRSRSVGGGWYDNLWIRYDDGARWMEWYPMGQDGMAGFSVFSVACAMTYER